MPQDELRESAWHPANLTDAHAEVGGTLRRQRLCKKGKFANKNAQFANLDFVASGLLEIGYESSTGKFAENACRRRSPGDRTLHQGKLNPFRHAKRPCKKGKFANKNARFANFDFVASGLLEIGYESSTGKFAEVACRRRSPGHRTLHQRKLNPFRHAKRPCKKGKFANKKRSICKLGFRLKWLARHWL